MAKTRGFRKQLVALLMVAVLLLGGHVGTQKAATPRYVAVADTMDMGQGDLDDLDDPDDPDDPSDPDDSGDPGDPDDSGDLDDPDSPDGNLDNPGNPDDPDGNPDNPGNPDDPDDPDDDDENDNDDDDMYGSMLLDAIVGLYRNTLPADSRAQQRAGSDRAGFCGIR